MSQILLLNGPNLNMLGKREPERYGHESLDDVVEQLTQSAEQLGHQLIHLQSNQESTLIERIHATEIDGSDFIIVNAASLTHSSIGLRDALLSVAKPFIEVHISNVYARENFRHQSYLSDIAHGVIIGLGTQGYALALSAADRYLSNPN